MSVKGSAEITLSNISDGAEGKSGKMLYGVCNTSGNDPEKTTQIEDFEIYSGVSVTIMFANENTAEAPTLNINSSGPNPIRTNGVPYAYWAAGAAVVFVYDGTYWNVASVPVYADTVTVGNPMSNNVYIDENSVNVRTGANVNAKFGAVSSIGNTNSTHILVKDTSIKFLDRDTILALVDGHQIIIRDLTDIGCFSIADMYFMYMLEDAKTYGLVALTSLNGSTLDLGFKDNSLSKNVKGIQISKLSNGTKIQCNADWIYDKNNKEIPIYQQKLAAGADLNSCQRSGYYFYYESTDPLNGTGSNAFLLFVYRVESTVIFQTMQSWDGKLWVRSCWYGSWQSWKEK